MAEANGRTVGELLRAKREEKKLTVAQVHAETKISVEMIEALEDDDYSSFPSELHLKGFLRNYAQLLELDANILWSSVGRRAPSADGAATVWDDEETLHEEKLSSPRLFQRVVLPVLILVIIVLGVLLVRENRKVRNLTTGAVAPIVGDGVTLVVGRQV